MIEDLKLVIFDMDGLMFDTERRHYEATIQAFKDLNIEIDTELLKNGVGTQNFDLNSIVLSELPPGFDLTEHFHKSRQKYLEDILVHGVPKKPGLDQLIQTLKANNIKIAVGTSTRRERAELYLRNAQVFELFDWVVTGSDITSSKPDPEIFLTACFWAAVPPKHALVLEDSIHGAIAAQRAGIKCIIVPDLVQPTPEVKRSAYAIVKDLYEVRNIIFS